MLLFQRSFVVKSCSTSLPGGDQVDGSPPAASFDILSSYTFDRYWKPAVNRQPDYRREDLQSIILHENLIVITKRILEFMTRSTLLQYWPQTALWMIFGCSALVRDLASLSHDFHIKNSIKCKTKQILSQIHFLL